MRVFHLEPANRAGIEFGIYTSILPHSGNDWMGSLARESIEQACVPNGSLCVAGIDRERNLNDKVAGLARISRFDNEICTPETEQHACVNMVRICVVDEVA